MKMKVAAFIVSKKSSNSYRYTIDLKISAETLADTYPVLSRGGHGEVGPFSSNGPILKIG